jgi:hypothetical protein
LTGKSSLRCSGDLICWLKATRGEAYVVEDACSGIDAQGSLAKAWTDMAQAGVKRIRSGDIEV